MSCEELYFLSEGQYSPEEELENKRHVTLHIVTLHPHSIRPATECNDNDCNSNGGDDSTVPAKKRKRSLSTTADKTNVTSTIANNDFGKTGISVCLTHDLNNGQEIGHCQTATNNDSDSIHCTTCGRISCNSQSIEHLIRLLRDVDSRAFVLDIDLDFFSTGNPFRSTFTAEQYELLSKIYEFTPPTNSTAEVRFFLSVEQFKPSAIYKYL